MIHRAGHGDDERDPTTMADPGLEAQPDILWAHPHERVLPCSNQGPPSPVVSPEAGEAEMTGDGPKVLVVDDDSSLSDAIRLRLRSYGIHVSQAFTGSEGFWKAVKEQPHVIITDYVMPDGYGNYLVRRLREHSLTRSIPVIVLTGCNAAGRSAENRDYALERQFLNLGAECVLPKPINHRKLLDLLRQHIRFPIADAAELIETS